MFSMVIIECSCWVRDANLKVVYDIKKKLSDKLELTNYQNWTYVLLFFYRSNYQKVRYMQRPISSVFYLLCSVLNIAFSLLT